MISDKWFIHPDFQKYPNSHIFPQNHSPKDLRVEKIDFWVYQTACYSVYRIITLILNQHFSKACVMQCFPASKVQRKSLAVSIIQKCALQYILVQCIAVECSAVQCNLVHYTTVLFTAVQFNAILFNTVQ